MPTYSSTIFSALTALFFSIQAAQAADTAGLPIELNGLSAVNGGCQMTFIVQNKLDVEVEDLALEVVLFDQNSKVIKFVKLGAGALPKSKTRVKRFTIAKTECTSIKRILVNDVARCKAGEMTSAQCLSALSLTNKTSADFGL